MTLTLEQQRNLGLLEPDKPVAPPTNAQKAAYIAHQVGIRAFAPFFTELLNRLEALENVNVAQAKRISDLELAAQS